MHLFTVQIIWCMHVYIRGTKLDVYVLLYHDGCWLALVALKRIVSRDFLSHIFVSSNVSGSQVPGQPERFQKNFKNA